ncbi:MAG: acyl-CoA/acyl-ACP dehydrogenase [Gammaproteobacteria bacterium]|nr:acyl-CoA/acyl-ACP dehydrogenase [Gammaproteobacteria bacterium]
MSTTSLEAAPETLRTLPGDDVRQILWRFADRFDLQMIVQSTRAVARGPVARLVAEGGRNSHEWTDGKNKLFQAYDEGGITGVFLEPEFGGIVEGPKNLALALVAWELAWVDAGAATSSLASNLAYAPINERGTEEQKREYMQKQAPLQPGEKRKQFRGSFALTEPLPYVGVDTGTVGGKLRVAEWQEGKEPILQVDKRGRFITNMDVANFVTVAVDSDDERIKGSCMIIVEDTDPGTFDKGAPTLKLVHQLSSTRDPVLNLKVPASRIIGGYTIQDGLIVPNYSLSDVLEAVFRRTRVTVGIMTSAKLLSAIEPVIRYQRTRARGGASTPDTPKYDLGIQQKEDARHRLVDVWASGEAGASFGFEVARIIDAFDIVEKEKEKVLEEQGVKGARSQLRVMRKLTDEVLEYLDLKYSPEDKRDQARYQELENNTLIQYAVTEAIANVYTPAVKLWNTSQGAIMMREAVSLMGGYGITEDCPGFLCQKWFDAQLEATYEGPEAVQRRQMSVTMINPVFIALMKHWIKELRGIAARKPETGACNLATAMQLWLWVIDYLQVGKDADGGKLYTNQRQGVTFPLADALSWLLTSRQQILDVLELEEKGPNNPVVAEGLEGTVAFLTDLCHVQAARSSGEVGRICAELVFGYNRHPAWDAEGCKTCFNEDELDELESVIPGIGSVADSVSDVISKDGTHPVKAGPCARFDGLKTFTKYRIKLDGCLTGSRLAKDRASDALMHVMIPEALDYPQ